MRSPRMPLVGALYFLAIVWSRPLVGQQATTPEPGTRVRVWVDSRRIPGYVVRLSADSILLRPSGTGPVQGWPRADVSRLEVSRGRRGHFWIGLAGGTVVGLVAGKIVADASAESGDDITAGVAGLAVWVGGAVAGGVVGALIRTERWAPGSWPQVKVAAYF